MKRFPLVWLVWFPGQVDISHGDIKYIINKHKYIKCGGPQAKITQYSIADWRQCKSSVCGIHKKQMMSEIVCLTDELWDWLDLPFAWNGLIKTIRAFLKTLSGVLDYRDSPNEISENTWNRISFIQDLEFQKIQWELSRVTVTTLNLSLISYLTISLLKS